MDLVRRAVDEDITTRELAEEVKRVKKSQREGATVGRLHSHAFGKDLGRLQRVREQAVYEPITAASFASHSPEQTRILLTHMEHWMRKLLETEA